MFSLIKERESPNIVQTKLNIIIIHRGNLNDFKKVFFLTFFTIINSTLQLIDIICQQFLDKDHPEVVLYSRFVTKVWFVTIKKKLLYKIVFYDFSLINNPVFLQCCLCCDLGTFWGKTINKKVFHFTMALTLVSSCLCGHPGGG